MKAPSLLQEDQTTAVLKLLFGKNADIAYHFREMSEMTPVRELMGVNPIAAVVKYALTSASERKFPNGPQWVKYAAVENVRWISIKYQDETQKTRTIELPGFIQLYFQNSSSPVHTHLYEITSSANTVTIGKATPEALHKALDGDTSSAAAPGPRAATGRRTITTFLSLT